MHVQAHRIVIIMSYLSTFLMKGLHQYIYFSVKFNWQHFIIINIRVIIITFKPIMLILEIFASTLPHARTEVAEVKTRYKSIFSKKQSTVILREKFMVSLFMKRQPLHVSFIMIAIPWFIKKEKKEKKEIHKRKVIKTGEALTWSRTWSLMSWEISSILSLMVLFDREIWESSVYCQFCSR